MKPIIGLSPLYDDEKQGLWMRPGYLDVLYACGAIPLVLPFDSDAVDVEQVLSICDGLVLTGGVDVDPHLYGEEPIPECGQIQHMRDELEYRLLDKALESDMPILGICRGSQILNVFLGGSLYQDLYTQLPQSLNHAMEPPYEVPCHRVVLEPGEPLQLCLGVDEIPVNSIHHQAVKRLAPTLVPLARSRDGVIEGSWMPGKRFVWGVQWHPEWIWNVDPMQKRIVQCFVDACEK
ncbi:MAG: gamma-glutamyl-gamma-aminobutyrate hydrolase family protein [Atopobiaceae bacterium]|nr:gamma-glutamyl-gamma-aminobutyrate hydrolase family protein [Atopobiaceae bacterium]